MDVLSYNSTSKMYGVKFLVDEYEEELDLTKIQLKVYKDSDYAAGEFKAHAEVEGPSLLYHAFESMTQLFSA